MSTIFFKAVNWSLKIKLKGKERKLHNNFGFALILQSEASDTSIRWKVPAAET